MLRFDRSVGRCLSLQLSLPLSLPLIVAPRLVGEIGHMLIDLQSLRRALKFVTYSLGDGFNRARKTHNGSIRTNYDGW